MADTLFWIATVIILMGAALAAVRLILGPSAADRAVALDSLTIASMSLIVILAVIASRAIYLDVALVYAILSFLGVLAIARYKEGGL